ncbi:MAG: ATP-binding cassette domain-containing protein [Proteobacteria bacterium]|nr:ATP-binding cassette domain-containing protein [Pseudomonadota bacterium]
MWPYIKPYKYKALFALLFSVPLGLLDSVIAWSLKPFMDNVLITKSVETATYIPFIIFGFALLQAILNYAATYLNNWVGLKTVLNLKKIMYRKLVNFESSFFDKRSLGEIMVRFSSDVEIACTGLLNHTKLFVTRIFSSISLTFILFYHSWQLALVAIVVLVISFYPLATYRRRIKEFTDQSVAEAGVLVTHYSQVTEGNKVVTSYNLQKRQEVSIINSLTRLFKLGMKMTQRTALLPSLMTLCVSSGIAVIIWYGSYLIVNDQLTGGEFVSFIAALILLYNPIKRLGSSFAALQASLLAMERVFTILETEPKIKDRAKTKELKGVKSKIELKNVCFEYEKDKPVLKNINLTSKIGQITALVGSSGGGKSTLVNLLPRFYDVTSGDILIDGKGIKNFSLHSLRENISIVLQDNFLFASSIRDNITLGKDYSEEQINKVLKSAYLDKFVESLEHGLETSVGERGVLLSGGQKQRISIARALLKDAPIVILDEATSALDNKSEKVVQKAMEKLMGGRTVFVIAHRLSTIVNADNIVVISDGKIVEQGTHKELLANKDSAYAILHTMHDK